MFRKSLDYYRLLPVFLTSTSHISRFPSHQPVMTTIPFTLLSTQFSSPFLRILCPYLCKVLLLQYQEKQLEHSKWGKHSQFHPAATSNVLNLEQQRPKHDPPLLWGILCSKEGCMYFSLQLWPSLVSHSTDHTCGVGEVKYSTPGFPKRIPRIWQQMVNVIWCRHLHNN